MVYPSQNYTTTRHGDAQKSQNFQRNILVQPWYCGVAAGVENVSGLQGKRFYDAILCRFGNNIVLKPFKKRFIVVFHGCGVENPFDVSIEYTKYFFNLTRSSKASSSALLRFFPSDLWSRGRSKISAVVIRDRFRNTGRQYEYERSRRGRKRNR